MKRMVLCLLAAVVMTACASGVMAAWVDDLNSYTTEMASPWESPNSQPLVSGWGNDGSQAARDDDGIGNATFRPIDATGAGFVFAQMKVGGAYAWAGFGVYGATTISDNMPWNAQNAAYIDLYNGSSSSTPPEAIVWRGGGRPVDEYIDGAWAGQSWHDVMIGWSADHMTIDFSFRTTGTTAWTTVSKTLATALTINYVGFGVRASSVGVDNIGFNAVPEPGSMVALLSGITGLAGFAIRRRK